jgi:Tol biopolymer transport system component
VYVVDSSGDTNLWFAPLPADGQPGGQGRAFLETASRESRPEPSPDGRWIAYVSNESGRNEVYISRFPEATGRMLASRDGGGEPRWRQDAKELYFLNGDLMMSVAIDLQKDPIAISAPQQLFKVSTAGALANYHYDVSAEGTRFVLVRDVKEDATTPTIVVVENWFAEFDRRSR